MKHVYNFDKLITHPIDSTCVVLRDSTETRLVVAIDHKFQYDPGHWEKCCVQYVDGNFEILGSNWKCQTRLYTFTDYTLVSRAASILRYESRKLITAYLNKCQERNPKQYKSI